MPTLKPLELGCIFWAQNDKPALDQIRALKALGLRCAQMGCSGEFQIEGKAAEWKAAAEAEDFALLAIVAAYDGEDYADIPTVERTVGFIPPATRQVREARTLALSDFGKALDVEIFACHVGFVPHDKNDANYIAVREMVRRIADHCAGNSQYFHLETGQEPAEVLLEFLADTRRDNLAINFDPANMILYGTSDPIEAIDVLINDIRSVHVKDGEWPTAPGQLGAEKPLGQGSVGIPRYIAKLKEIGYQGPLVIEREGTTPEIWTENMKGAIALLNTLV